MLGHLCQFASVLDDAVRPESILAIGADAEVVAAHFPRVPVTRGTLDEWGQLAVPPGPPAQAATWDVVLVIGGLESVVEERVVPALQDLAERTTGVLIVVAPMQAGAARDQYHYWLSTSGLLTSQAIEQALVATHPALIERLVVRERVTGTAYGSERPRGDAVRADLGAALEEEIKARVGADRLAGLSERMRARREETT